MNNAGIRLAIFLAVQALCLQTAYSGESISPKISEELARQEGIYRSAGEKVPEGYTIDRALPLYIETLSAPFERALQNLGPTDRWLDIGAGKGLAILDYYNLDYDPSRADGRERRARKAQAIAISIEDRRTPLWDQTATVLAPGKIQYLFNKRLREFSFEELGRFQIITDVIGGFSYTEDLSLFTEKTLGFLALNGSFFTLMQDVHSAEGANKPFYPKAPFLTEIKKADGSEVKICSWLKSISCVEVTCEFKARWKPPIEVYHVRKICNDVVVPALVPRHYEAGTPPERRFELKN